MSKHKADVVHRLSAKDSARTWCGRKTQIGVSYAMGDTFTCRGRKRAEERMLATARVLTERRFAEVHESVTRGTLTPKERSLRVHLRNLTAAALECVALLDALMKLPATPKRGSAIALVRNHLEWSSDLARMGLGVSLRGLSKRPVAKVTEANLDALIEALRKRQGGDRP